MIWFPQLISKTTFYQQNTHWKWDYKQNTVIILEMGPRELRNNASCLCCDIFFHNTHSHTHKQGNKHGYRIKFAHKVRRDRLCNREKASKNNLFNEKVAVCYIVMTIVFVCVYPCFGCSCIYTYILYICWLLVMAQWESLMALRWSVIML